MASAGVCPWTTAARNAEWSVGIHSRQMQARVLMLCGRPMNSKERSTLLSPNDSGSLAARHDAGVLHCRCSCRNDATRHGARHGMAQHVRPASPLMGSMGTVSRAGALASCPSTSALHKGPQIRLRQRHGCREKPRLGAQQHTSCRLDTALAAAAPQQPQQRSTGSRGPQVTARNSSAELVALTEPLSWLDVDTELWEVRAADSHRSSTTATH